MPDTPTGEPAALAAASNEPSTPATPPAVTSTDTGELERLRKEAENATLRANQLANEKKALEDAEAARKAKELEDKEQFKTLYEQKEAELAELKRDKEANEKAAAVKAESDKVLADYPEEVRKLATTTGLTLTDTDDATVTAFKAKLEEVKGMVGPAPKVAPNNPSAPTPQGPTFTNADGVIDQPLEKNPNKTDELFRDMPGIASMMDPDLAPK